MKLKILGAECFYMYGSIYGNIDIITQCKYKLVIFNISIREHYWLKSSSISEGISSSLFMYFYQLFVSICPSHPINFFGGKEKDMQNIELKYYCFFAGLRLAKLKDNYGKNGNCKKRTF